MSSESLKSYIISLYGEVVFQLTRKFEKLRVKKETLLCDLAFLKRCRDQHIIPVCFQLRFHIKTSTTQKILKKASVALLRNSINRTCFDLDCVSLQLYHLHLELSSVLHPTTFQKLDHFAALRAEDQADKVTQKQVKKFDNLSKHQKSPVVIASVKKLDPNTVVRNFSSHILSKPEQDVLSKGFNFAVTPNRLPTESIICGVEAALIGLPKAKAEQIRQDTARILSKSKLPANNLTREERSALRDLKENPDIVILKADKGNATVVMDKAIYKKKMEVILEDPVYKVTKNDPTVYLEKTTRSYILSSNIDKDRKKGLIPREKSSRIPRFYGLPKIHKEGVPLRPIVDAAGCPTQPLAGYLASIFQPLSENAKSYVKNATHLVELMQDMSLDPEDILVSFDVVSLFTRIPITEALEVIKEKYDYLDEDIFSLAKHCMSNTYFLYDGLFYKQVDGAPMGSPLSPVVANLFMEYFEEMALASSSLKPKCWLRYVDDTFVVWPHGRDTLEEFVAHLNSIHGNIKFIMEVEKDGKLPFLDVLVMRKQDGTLGHTVYRKPTHTNRYLSAFSHHHPAQIRSVAYTLATRSRRIADADNLQNELDTLRDALMSNGYSNKTVIDAITKASSKSLTLEEQTKEDDTLPMAFLPYVKGTTDRIGRLLARVNIKTVYKPCRKIGEMLASVKDIVHLEGKGVYEVPCNDCTRTYIGQTGRKISIRLNEHRNSVSKYDKTSTLAQHAVNSFHQINFAGSSHIASERSKFCREIREAVEIEKRPHNMNTRDDSKRLPSAWVPILSSMKVAPMKRVTQAAEVDMTKKNAPKEISGIHLSSTSGPVTRSRTRKCI